MYATYGQRTVVHPDRYGSAKSNGPNLWAILHTSEGGESNAAAENLCSYLTQPGDRPNSSGGRYGSSYHVIFDTDRVMPCVPYNVVSYSAGGGNAQGIHGCFPGRAGQTRQQWLDDVSRPMIRQCAAWLLDIEAEFGIPMDRKMFPSAMLAGDKGVGDHFTVTEAFGKTDHTDVGAGFPWDILFADIDALRTPIEENDDMTYLFKLPSGDYGLRGPSGSRRVSGEEFGQTVPARDQARQVAAGSNEEYWIGRELAAYDRALGI